MTLAWSIIYISPGRPCARFDLRNLYIRAQNETSHLFTRLAGRQDVDIENLMGPLFRPNLNKKDKRRDGSKLTMIPIISVSHIE